MLVSLIGIDQKLSNAFSFRGIRTYPHSIDCTYVDSIRVVQMDGRRFARN
jgi:hypothetical protein